MFYAFEYFPDKPPVVVNGNECPRGRLLQFSNRLERRQYVDSVKHVGIVGKNYADLLREANHA